MKIHLTEKQIDVLIGAAEASLAMGIDGDAFESADDLRRLRHVCDKLKNLPETHDDELIAANALIKCAENWDAFDQMAEDPECYEIIKAYRDIHKERDV